MLAAAGERARHFDQRRAAEPVVFRAVEDAVGRLAEMIPVRGVDDVLVLELRIGSLESADDVLRVDRPQLVPDRHRRRHAQRHRLEVARRGQRLQRVEILARRLQQRLSPEPSAVQLLDRRAPRVLVRGVANIELLARLPLDDVEAVPRGTGLVDDQDAGRAFLRADLVLVGPAAVVRHRLAAERLRIELPRVRRIRHRRIVDEHHEQFWPSTSTPS